MRVRIGPTATLVPLWALERIKEAVEGDLMHGGELELEVAPGDMKEFKVVYEVQTLPSGEVNVVFGDRMDGKAEALVRVRGAGMAAPIVVEVEDPPQAVRRRRAA